VGGKFPASALKEEQVQAYWEEERQGMHRILDDYLRICQRMGVTIVIYAYAFRKLFNFALITF